MKSFSGGDIKENSIQQAEKWNPRSSLSLRIASMNIALAQPSQMAPETWNQSAQENALRQELLQQNADVIMLQECPSEGWVRELLVEADKSYRLVGVTRSHAGLVALLVRSAGVFCQSVELVSFKRRLPIVAAKVSFNDQNELILASCHLKPYETGSNGRLEQMRELHRYATRNVSILVAGDTNMRDIEDDEMEEMWIDLWKKAGSDPRTRYTWDTVDHTATSSSSSSSFNQYYGRDTRQYQRRYDRIYASMDAAYTTEVQYFDLFAHRPIPPSQRHFLSDHFGMAVEVTLSWNKQGHE